MIRLAAAVGVALCVSQATLHAQAPIFTVQAESADVYKAPSTGSAVIGHAPRGTALHVQSFIIAPSRPGAVLRATRPSPS